MLPIRACQQDAGIRARRPDDNPPFRPAVIGQGWRILDQVESEDAGEEGDGRVVLGYDDGDQVQLHLQESTDRRGGVSSRPAGS